MNPGKSASRPYFPKFGRSESQAPHKSKQPQEVVKRSRGGKCLADRSRPKHTCSKTLDRGEVCKDEIHDCENCKKNGEFIEVVVRCAQERVFFAMFLFL